MNVDYKSTPDEKRELVSALKAARWRANSAYPSFSARLAAANELAGYGYFSAEKIYQWLGVPPQDEVQQKWWSARDLRKDQLGIAIELAQAGVDDERPKLTIYDARVEYGMSYGLIGCLLGIHRNEVRRIVNRLEGVKVS